VKYAGIASIPERERALEQVVESLLPQVDRIGVVLNKYQSVPMFLIHQRVDVLLDRRGEERDLAKFHWQAACEGHYFSCDDDLVYPPWYIEHMYRELEDRDAMRTIVTLHGWTGRRMNKRTVYSCLDRVVGTHEVLVGGTGAMLHFAPALKLETSHVYGDRADMWIARSAHTQGLKIFVLAHERGALEYLEPPEGTTLWDESTRDGHRHSDALLKGVIDAHERHRRHGEQARVHPMAVRPVQKAVATG